MNATVSSTARGTPPLLQAVTFALALALSLSACGDSAEQRGANLVEEAIEAHGGDEFQRSVIEFGFRGDQLLVARLDDRFRQERVSVDSLGTRIREQMTNDGTRVWADGREVELTEDERSTAELRVNSVIYFAFLPHRLDDPAARPRALGEVVVAGEPYNRVEVTFTPDGGGEDWEDRFVYWLHADRGTLDYMAYRYERDGGGTRFRRAINRREVGGVVLQDYENFDGGEEVRELEDYPTLWDEGRLELISLIELENVDVRSAGPGDTSPDAAPPSGATALVGIQLNLAIDEPVYSPGAAMQIRIGLGNRTDQDRTLSFRTSQRYDLAFFDEDNVEVARWSADRSFLQVLGDETVLAGEEGPVWGETWRVPTEPGTYRFDVMIPTTLGTLQTGTSVEVEGAGG